MAEKKEAKKAVAAKPKKPAAKPAEKKQKAEKPAKPKAVELKGAELAGLKFSNGMHIYDVIVHPLITEKAVNMIDSENKLCFVVNKNANKGDVKKAVEALYAVRIDSVRIFKDMKSRKRAIVRLAKEYKAEDVATKLGVL
jgi:ribosomal protein uL23